MTNEKQKAEQLQEEFAQKIKDAHQQEAGGQLTAKKRKSAMAGKAALLLIGLIVGIFISGSLGVNFSNTSGGRILGASIFSSDETVIEKNGQTWVAYDDSIIDTTVVTNSDCETCDPTETIEMIRQNLLPTIKVTEIESDSEEAKRLIEKFNIKAIPAFVFSAELAEAKNFEKASSVFLENDGRSLLASPKAGLKIGEYLEIPKVSDADARKGPADAPITIIEISEFQCPYCNKAKETVDELMELANQADTTKIPDGMNVPEEITRREDRLVAIAEAKEKIEQRANERYAEEKQKYDDKMAVREAKAEKTGKKPRGRTPQPPESGPCKKDQVNLTDEESRIMPTSGKGFD